MGANPAILNTEIKFKMKMDRLLTQAIKGISLCNDTSTVTLG